MTVVAIVPAAGAAERFGGRKLVADVDGEPLLARTVAALRDRVAVLVVVVGPGADELRALPALADPKVRVVENPDPSRGMLSSIQAGLAIVDWAAGYAVLPGDMPYVRADTVRELVERFACTSGGIVSPRYHGKRGHPVIVPGQLRDEVLTEDPRSNLHEVLKRHPADRVDVEVDDPGVIRDVDTIEDLTVTR